MELLAALGLVLPLLSSLQTRSADLAQHMILVVGFQYVGAA